MKYIIMCGGTYLLWDKPRQLLEVKGEPIIKRTIRLLKQNGIEDIAISSGDPRFEGLGVPVLVHDNEYTAANEIVAGYWNEAFYPTDEPTCYLFGDVVFSPEAIKKIVNTDTDDVMFFGSAPPYAPEYVKQYAEPFAFKVVNQDHFKSAIRLTQLFYRQGMFKRRPIAWELWQVIKNHKLNHIDYNSYVHINDYTCDVDEKADLIMIESMIEEV